MRKIITIALLSILLLSCSSERTYDNVGIVDKYEIYTNFNLLELSRNGLQVNSNGYERIVVKSFQNSTFNNYYFVAISSNRVGEPFIYHLPTTSMNRLDKIVFEVPKFQIKLLEEKDTEIEYRIMNGIEIIQQFKFITK